MRSFTFITALVGILIFAFPTYAAEACVQTGAQLLEQLRIVDPNVKLVYEIQGQGAVIAKLKTQNLTARKIFDELPLDTFKHYRFKTMRGMSIVDLDVILFEDCVKGWRENKDPIS